VRAIGGREMKVEKGSKEGKLSDRFQFARTLTERKKREDNTQRSRVCHVEESTTANEGGETKIKLSQHGLWANSPLQQKKQK